MMGWLERARAHGPAARASSVHSGWHTDRPVEQFACEIQGEASARARLRRGMNRAGHRHQQWHARTEQQQQVVVSAPGGLCDGASSTSERRAAEPSPGSELGRQRRLYLASACPHDDDEAFSPAERHTTSAEPTMLIAVEKACLHRMVQAAAGIPIRNVESRVPQGAPAAERLSGAGHGMTTFKSASQGERFRYKVACRRAVGPASSA